MAAAQQVEEVRPSLSPRSQRGGRPRHEVAALLGDHILDVASGQFALHGVAGVSMDMIAAAAHVSKRTLYSRFGSKNGLLHAVIEQEIAQGLEPILATIPCEAGVGEKILRLTRGLLDRSLEPRSIGLELLIRETALHAPGFDGPHPSLGAGIAIETIRTILCEGLPAGHDADELEFLAAFLFDTLVLIPRSRILDRRQLSDTPAAKTEYFRRTVELIAPLAPFLAGGFGEAGQLRSQTPPPPSPGETSA